MVETYCFWPERVLRRRFIMLGVSIHAIHDEVLRQQNPLSLEKSLIWGIYWPSFRGYDAFVAKGARRGWMDRIVVYTGGRCSAISGRNSFSGEMRLDA